jgi:hypothetical protein
MEWVLAAIGLLGGFALSAMWWWLLAHKFVPQLSFGDGIAETDDAGSGCVRYRVKVENTGRRDIIDIAFRARIYLPKTGLFRTGKVNTTTAIMEVPVDPKHLFMLGRGEMRIMWLELDLVDGVWRKYLDAAMVDRLIERQEGSLQAVLQSVTDSRLVVQVLAYDGWSRARKYYASPRYRSTHVLPQSEFKGLDLVVRPMAVHDADGQATVEGPPDDSVA